MKGGESIKGQRGHKGIMAAQPRLVLVPIIAVMTPLPATGPTLTATSSTLRRSPRPLFRSFPEFIHYAPTFSISYVTYNILMNPTTTIVGCVAFNPTLATTDGHISYPKYG